MSTESDLLNVVSRREDDYTGPQPRPDLAIRNLEPNNKDLSMQIARQQATASGEIKALRPLVSGSLPQLVIDGVNFVSPNARSQVAQVSLENIVLKNNTNDSIVDTIPINENPQPTILWKPSGDAIWIHFKERFSPADFIYITATMKNTIMSATNEDGDQNEIEAVMWTQFLNCNWDPTTICWDNQPGNFDTATVKPFPLSTFGLNLRYFSPGLDESGETNEVFVAGEIGPGATLSNGADNVANPGINDYLNNLTDTSNELQIFGHPLVSPAATTTTFRLSGWPYNYSDSGSSTDIELVIFNSQYNQDQPTAFTGAFVTVTPWDLNQPGGKIVETGLVATFASDGTFTMQQPLSYAPRAPTHVIQVNVFDPDTDTFILEDRTVPDFAHTDSIRINFMANGVAIRIYAIQIPQFYTNGHDFLTWKAQFSTDSISLNAVPVIQSLMKIPGAQLP